MSELPRLTEQTPPEPGLAADLMPALVLGEQVGGLPFEGYRIFTRRLGEALARLGPTEIYSIGGESAPGIARMPDWRPLISPQVWRAVRRLRPKTVFYVHAATLPAMVRARLIAGLGASRMVMVGLEPATRPPIDKHLSRLLWPDLLFTTAEGERLEVAALGARARRFSTGVDLDRFRPPLPGEKAEQRRKWGLPTDAHVVLHVGHLHPARNIKALAAVARRPGMLAVALVSGLHPQGAQAERQELERAGILVLDGYQSNVEGLYRAADCYVFPVPRRSGAIAMPLSVLEALASDLPVVTTRFGALPERFEGADGVEFIDDERDLVPAVERVGARPHRTRQLAEPYAWNAVIEDLLRQSALVPARHGGWASLPPLLSALAWRRAWLAEDRLRQRFWSRDLGFTARPIPAPGSITAGEPRLEVVGTSPAADSNRAGLIGASPAFVGVAHLAGLEVQTASGPGSSRLLATAVRERWPLVCVQADGLTVPHAAARHLNTFVRAGGTLLVEGSPVRSSAGMESLEQALDMPLPRPLPAGGMTSLRMSAQAADLAFELAGSSFSAASGSAALVGGRGRPVISSKDGRPILVEYLAGAGRVLVSCTGEMSHARPGDCYTPEAAAALLPAMMAVRRACREVAWHPPLRLANLTVDDPGLRQGTLGLDWSLLLEEAQRWNFHLTAATIPRELELADQSVVRLFLENPRRLSACYHGNNHSGYEFYVATRRRVRFSSRSASEQRRSLEQAAERGRRFQEVYGFALDRVMVFPHGLCAAGALADLARTGFLATCNWLDRYPLAAPVPDDFDLGMRPADLAWGGMPLLWRRDPLDPCTLLDLFLGRPALLFCHPAELRGGAPEALIKAVGMINQAGGDGLRWAGLEWVARHAYLQRQVRPGSWEVMMTANEVCLHNPDESARAYLVTRPRRPAGAVLEVGPGQAVDADSVTVIVPRGETVAVRLVYAGLKALPGRGSQCELAEGGSARSGREEAGRAQLLG